jgi:hypothetical protein
MISFNVDGCVFENDDGLESTYYEVSVTTDPDNDELFDRVCNFEWVCDNTYRSKCQFDSERDADNYIDNEVLKLSEHYADCHVYRIVNWSY